MPAIHERPQRRRYRAPSVTNPRRRGATMSDGTSAEPRLPARLVRFTPSAALLVTTAVVVAFVLRNAFVAAHQIVGWIVACSLVALLIDPIVNLVQRLLPRLLSVVVVVVAMIGVIVGVVVGLTRELLNSLDDLEEAAPEAARGLEERYDWAVDLDVTARVADLVERINEAVRTETIERAFGRLPTFLVTGVLMLFLLAFGRRYVLGFLSLFDDLGRRHVVRRVLFVGARRGRVYILCTLAHSLFNGLIFGTACWLLDLPAPLSLGVAVALLNAIPLIGTFIGGLPALLLAFGSSSWRVGVTVLILLVTLQAVEVVVVRPIVDVRSVRVGTTVAVVAALIAFDLYGVGAAICAVALAAIALAALDVYGASRDEELAGAEP
jgi:predicted PurR-regulated permease PerM